MERTDGQNFGWWSGLCRALVGLFLKMIPVGEAFDPGLYKAIAPFITTIVVEVIICRRGEKNGIDVWLEKCDQNAAEEWFCPGDVLRPGEQARKGDTLMRIH
ncbi:MAG: hypothetical protein Q8M83_00875 [bacterium]|nr:hypothetical protein [bacterium]